MEGPWRGCTGQGYRDPEGRFLLSQELYWKEHANGMLALWLRSTRATTPGNSGKANLQHRLLKLRAWLDTI